MLYLRKVFGLGLTLVLLIVMACAQFSGGSGTQSNPWQVSTARQLNNVRNYLGEAHDDKYFIQTEDIDLGAARWNKRGGWLPIGNYDDSFCANYNGNGKVVSNLFINRQHEDYQGLFGSSAGFIQKLVIKDANVIGRDGCGGLVGGNWGTISNCYARGRVSGDSDVGGLVGWNMGPIDNCFSMVSVSGNKDHGGLVGGSYDCTLSNGYWDIQVSGQAISNGGEGRTTGEMTFPYAANTYINWDWRIWKPDVDHSVNDGYPFIRSVDDLPINLPEPAVNPIPADKWVSIPLDYMLLWHAGFSITNTDPPSGFKLWLGTDNPPSNIINGLDLGYTNEFDPSPHMIVNTCYYWRVVPYNQVGEALNVPIWTFSTYSTTGFGGGTGIEQDPWQIDNADHLYNLRYYIGEDHSDKHFAQTTDIDLGIAPWNHGGGWMPIGYYDYYNDDDTGFYGHYNGNGKVIANLFLNRPNRHNQGLFGFFLGKLQNLGLENASVHGNWDTGSLVGENSGVLSNCYSTGIMSGYSRTGGLVGYNNDGELSDCYSMSNVVGNMFIGGLVGQQSGALSNCYSAGSVSGEDSSGGLVGWNDEGLIRNCSSTSNVKGKESTSGLVGYNCKGSLSNCYSTGSVDGEDYSGGLVGWNYEGEIRNCYSTSNVKGKESTSGFVGYNQKGSLSNCFCTGSIRGEDYSGGLVGQNSEGAIRNCYWDMQSSDQSTSDGGEGRNTEEMTFPHAANTYVNWSWRTWEPDADHSINGGYPFLRPVTQVPEAAVNPIPANQVASVPVDYILQWQEGLKIKDSGPVSGFKLWLGTDNPPSNIINGLDLGYVTEFDPKPHLAVSNIYYWRIVPYNQIGEANNVPVWSFGLTTGFDGGSGTEHDPWQISNAEQLYYNLRQYVGTTHADKHFIQTADIDLGVAPWNQKEGWEPIGTEFQNRFCGKYNGNGKVISNLFINRPNSDYQGLFGYSSGHIQSLGIEDVSVSGNNYTGGLVGQNYGTLNNCYSAGSIDGDDDTGGLVGQNSGMLSNCYSTGSLNGNRSTGGLVGYNSSGGAVSDCYSNASVSGYYGTGGIVGSNFGIFNNCRSNGNVNGEIVSGGFVGRNYEDGKLTSCYSTSSVSGDRNIGGLAGSNSKGTISNCYSIGSVNGKWVTGGLVGENSGTLSNCYCTGSVTGRSHVGGLVGKNSDGKIKNCYWNTLTSGQKNSDGGEGRTTREMVHPHALNTFMGWDFQNVWVQDTTATINDGFPFLRFQLER